MKLTLNIGAGTRTYKHYPNDGYNCINIDERDLPGIDYVEDVSNLHHRWRAEQFDYILASDIIEHFPIAKTRKVLYSWYIALKSGGIIELKLPNLGTIFKEYSQHKNQCLTNALLMGNQDYPGNFHYVAFDEVSFTKILTDLKLDILEVKQEGTNMLFYARK